MPKQNLSQKELKDTLKRLLLQRETYKKQETDWLASVNYALGRSFSVVMYAESNLRNELKHMETITDPRESAEETISRIDQDFVNELLR